MRRKISVYPTGHAFLGKSVAEDGYIGDVEAQFNAVTITLIKPGTTTEDIIRSLEITIQDVRLRGVQPDNIAKELLNKRDKGKVK